MKPNQLNLIPSYNKFELECKNKQFNDCCDSNLDEEVIDKHNESSSCDNLHAPDDNINNSSNLDYNTSPVSVRQENDNKLSDPPTPGCFKIVKTTVYYK